jgi:iron complex transport system substrate-binding protein
MLYTVAPDLLLGWPRANRPEEREFLLPDIGNRPEVGRVTGRGNTANLEAVLAHKPDLILDIGSVTATYVSLADRVQEQTGIPYALLDGRFDGTAAAYRMMGELIGRREAADALARYTEETIKTISGRITAIPRDRQPRVYYARGPRGLETGLGGSINVETIEFLAQNVAGGTPGGLANVSIEQVLLWNPEVIVTIDRDFAANVYNDRAWAPIEAVRERRVYLSPKLPFGWVDFPPSANRLIGLWWLAKILYPDRFPEDLRSLSRDFYRRFYHVTLGEAQIDRVLAGRD